MNKSERDQILSTINGDERTDLRRIMRGIQTESRESGGARSRQEVLESHWSDYPKELERSMEAIMRRDRMGPGEGEIPPAIHLKLMGSEDRVRLSQFKDKRPVALVFSSYT